jgi:hypothetical protein
MAISVKGFFKNPYSKFIVEDPILELVPHLVPYGNISIDVNIKCDNENMGAVPFIIDRENLIYDESINDGHDRLFNALQGYVLEELQDTNNNCTFTIIQSVDTEL